MWTTSISMDTDRRGQGIPANQRTVVKRLRSQAFAMQRHFDLAEHSALILEQSLGSEDGSIAESVNNTFEAHAFSILQTQLYRLLIVDVSACVLDKNPITGSVRAILKELRRDSIAMDALRAYYSDRTCLKATVEGTNLNAATIERRTAEAIEKSVQESIDSIDRTWAGIDKDSSILNNDQAKRILWARHKTTAHIERTDTGVVALEDVPPYGTGSLTWNEPILFFESVRSLVYDVY